ncbi:hypothetical protein P9112_003899 [Eukaryota sp. TZLM1-RC]
MSQITSPQTLPGVSHAAVPEFTNLSLINEDSSHSAYSCSSLIDHKVGVKSITPFSSHILVSFMVGDLTIIVDFYITEPMKLNHQSN